MLSACRGRPLLRLAQAAGQDLRDLDGDLGMLLEQRRELPGGEAERAHGRLGDHRRRAAAAALVQQRHLAKRSARAERAAALSVRLDASGALRDHKEPDAALALAHDHVTRVVAALLRCVGHCCELPRRSAVAERYSSQDRDALVCHATPLFAGGAHSTADWTPGSKGLRCDVILGSQERCARWVKERDWKLSKGGFLVRGFESRPLR